MTEHVVIDFQKSKGVEPNGVVGPETWKALGTLVAQGPEAPDPAVVNAETKKRGPADALDGPPFVSCKVWAIADGMGREVVADLRDRVPQCLLLG